MATAPATRPNRRPRRLWAKPKPPLTVAEILAWADAFKKRRGRWPISKDGRIREAVDDTWCSVDKALRGGRRGLPVASSMARLLSEHRGVRNRKGLPPYTVAQVLTWADEHYRRTGRWPNEDSGPIKEATGETWKAVEAALRQGARGFPGGSSLARLLAKRRGARNVQNLPRLTIAQILAWADAHFKRTRRWPKKRSGEIPESPTDNWALIDAALYHGYRGLPGRETLAQVLGKHRGARNHKALPHYAEDGILAWADAHHRRTGTWPKHYSGPIGEAPGETWLAVNTALSSGARGLPGGTSLARLLQRHRGHRNIRCLQPFCETKILKWARAHRRRTDKLPTAKSGPVIDSPGDTWMAVQVALRMGRRGLPGGSSLSALLQQLGGARHQLRRPRLTKSEIIEWARAHLRHIGRFPTKTSGPIIDSPGDTWMAVQIALRIGLRGLPGGSSLSKLLKNERQKDRSKRDRMPLSIPR
jgi:hypothetical protein